MAAGLSVEKEKIVPLRTFLNEQCQSTIEEMAPQTMIDMQLPLEWLNLKLAKAQQALEPFGKGNPVPVFADRRVFLTQIQLLGASEQVVRAIFQLRNDNGMLQTIMFRQQRPL